MTKFRDLDDNQKSAFQELIYLGIERRIKEEIDYTSQLLRLLLLGNGTGIALLFAFMGAIAASGNPVSELVSPLWKFFIGAFFASLIYAPLFAVAVQATNHTITQTIDFLQNKIDLEEMQGWGLTKTGVIFIQILASISLILFFWGVYQCVLILEKL